MALAGFWLLAPALAGQAPEGGSGAPWRTVPVPFASREFVDLAILEGERLSLERERRAKTYHDPKTGLLWTRGDNGKDINWPQAVRYCDELEAAGYDDWRLPSIEELESLHDRKAAKKFNTPDAVQLTACCPWSVSQRDEGSIWNFNFHFRRRFSGSSTYTFELRALCVRTPAPDEVFPAPEELGDDAAGKAKSKKKKRRRN